MLTSTGPLLPLCSSMIVSVRWPTSPPVARSFSCSGSQAGAAVGTDDQPVRAGPGARALGGQGVDAVERGVDPDAEADDRQQQHEQQHAELAAPTSTASRSADGGWAARRLDGRTIGNALTRRLGRWHHRGRPGRVRPGWGRGGTAAHGPGRARRPRRRQRRRGRPLLRGGTPGTAPRPGGPPRTAAVVTAHVAHHPASVRSRPSSRFARYAGARRRRRGASTRQTASRHRMASECSGWGTGPVPQVVHSLANSCRLARTNVPTRGDERADSRVRRGRAGGTARGRRRPDPPAPAG